MAEDDIDRATPTDEPATVAVATRVAAALIILVVVSIVGIWAYTSGLWPFDAKPGAGGATGPGARPWHYWLAPVLAASFVLLATYAAFGYYRQVILPRLRGR